MNDAEIDISRRVFTRERTGPCRRLADVLPLLFCVSLIGCYSGSSSPETRVAPEDSLHTETERGPVNVRVEVVPKEPQLSDEPQLTLTITAADGVEVKSPPFGESLGEFLIRDFYEPIPSISDGRQIIQQIYTLEPMHAGTITIDPIVITFVDKRPEGDDQAHTVETESLRIPVTTIIESEAPSLADLRPAAPPVELAEESNALMFFVIGVVVIFSLLLLVQLFRRRRLSSTATPVVPPEILARQELDALISSGISRTDVKEFFAQLTGIVRRYIERSTGVRAPEQTTEEFLHQVRDQKVFPEEINASLGVFLESADLVKFAGFQPDSDAITESTQKAKQFIELKEKTVEVVAEASA